MKKYFIAVISVLLLGFLTSCGTEDVYTDYDKALAASKAKNKDLMLIFTATDSNKDDSSISELEKINNNIFNSKDFISGVKENYIVCTLVYEIPSPGETDTEENLKIQDLMNYYRVPNVPSIYLILPQGDVYALPVVTDENSVDGKTFAEYILTFSEEREETLAALEAINNSQGEERLANLDNFISMSDQYIIHLQKPYMEEIVELTKDNNDELYTKYSFILGDIKAADFFVNGDVNSAIKVFEELLETLVTMTNEQKQNAYYKLAYLSSFATSDYNVTLNYLDQAINIDPTNAFSAELIKFKTEMEEAVEQQEAAATAGQ